MRRRPVCSPVRLGDMAAPLAITMGDASGVGPEIVLRTFCEGGLGEGVVVYGDAAILHHGARVPGPEGRLGSFPDRRPRHSLSASDHKPGRVDAKTGAAAWAYIERATLTRWRASSRGW